MDPLMSRVSFCLYFLMIKLSTTQNIMALRRKKLYEQITETEVIQSQLFLHIFSSIDQLNLISKLTLHQECPWGLDESNS